MCRGRRRRPCPPSRPPTAPEGHWRLEGIAAHQERALCHKRLGLAARRAWTPPPPATPPARRPPRRAPRRSSRASPPLRCRWRTSGRGRGRLHTCPVSPLLPPRSARPPQATPAAGRTRLPPSPRAAAAPCPRCWPRSPAAPRHPPSAALAAPSHPGRAPAAPTLSPSRLHSKSKWSTAPSFVADPAGSANRLMDPARHVDDVTVVAAGAGGAGAADDGPGAPGRWHNGCGRLSAGGERRGGSRCLLLVVEARLLLPPGCPGAWCVCLRSRSQSVAADAVVGRLDRHKPDP